MLRKFLAKLPVEAGHQTMWKSFFKSIGLLALALLAALYSASAGPEPDHARNAVIASLIALALSLWVGIRFVPRLARGVDWDWIPFISQYKVTREGWVSFGALTIVVFAAINTNNNLLYMVLAALLAVLLLSGFLSVQNLRFVRLDLRLPSRCFAGETFPFGLEIHNEKRLFPMFSLRIEPSADSPVRFRDFYFTVIRAQGHVSQAGEAAFRRRGRHAIRKIRAMSRYPFGFLARGYDLEVEADCLCYPEIIPQDQMNLGSLDIQGSQERFERGLGNDLYTIRDYVPSDSARHVHWKASAKTSTLKTREYAAEESRRMVLAFDRFGLPADSDKFEHQVSHAASLALHLIEDGVDVVMVSDDWESSRGSSSVVLDSILNYLAVVEMEPAAAIPSVDLTSGALLLSLRQGNG